MLTDDAPQIAVIRMKRPRGNAINDGFMQALESALGDAEHPRVSAVVLVGDGNVFCAGLDLVETYGYDRQRMHVFVDAFETFFERVFTFPKPIVAAVNGHAIAGGSILAMAADARIMADTDARIGITEVAVGIPFPAAAFEIARSATRPDAERSWFLEGRRHTPREAQDSGVVHEIVAKQELETAAKAAARQLAAAPSAAFAAVKAQLRREARERISETRIAAKERFLDAWFSPEVYEKRTAIRDGLLKREASSG